MRGSWRARACAIRPPRSRSAAARFSASWARSRLLLRAEVHCRRLGDRLLVLHRELRLGLEAEHHRREIVREGAHERIEFLHRLDVALPRDGDAVLGALELRLEIAEVLV